MRMCTCHGTHVEDNLGCWSSPSTLFEAWALVLCSIHQAHWSFSFCNSPISASPHPLPNGYTTVSSFSQVLKI